MLYRILKWLFYPTVKGYFRSLHVEGRSSIPHSGPLIFVANHNSAFMDPILLGVHIRKPVFFLARGEAFKSKLASWIFRFLNMIPVYRPEISPDEMHKNKMVFQRCFDHLKKGKTIMIFPEGYSKTVRTLRQLKTGTARIALGAEDQNDFKLNLSIVPIGINYSDPHTFRSDVFVNFGLPIEIGEYKEDYLKNEKDAVIKLTKEIEDKLEELLVIVKEERIGKMLNQVETITRSEFDDETESQRKAKESFDLSRDIAKALELLGEKDPKRLMDLKTKIDCYFEELDKLKIRDAQIRRSKSGAKFSRDVLNFIFGLPVFVFGLLVNFLPYRTVGILSDGIKVREDFIGSLKLALGMFIFLIFYIIEAVALGYILNWYWALIFVLSLYPAGVFTINYIKNYYLYESDFRYDRLLRNKNDLIEKLKSTRLEITKVLDELLELDRSDLP